MDKIFLVQVIGGEVCEECGEDRDCGLEYDDCDRIGSSIKYLDDFMEESKK